jgi:tRNA 2-selenouridine synthase
MLQKVLKHVSSFVIIDISQFLTLRGQLPLVDVRSENEYGSGHVPCAVNIPLLNNNERAIVGTTYKQKGQQQAIKEGFRLVGPRLLEIVNAAENIGREFIVHCWRGGMRSGNFCQFVQMAGIKTHQLKGGYKAYRQYALKSFEKNYPLVIVSGLTGSGKTEILRALQAAGEQVIDLEGLANHKGSVFGGLGQPEQPTTEQFENNLFEALYKLDPGRRIWIEDESIAVGKIFLPSTFWRAMCSSPVVSVNVPKAARIERLVNEYGVVDRADFASALKGITKKLGGQHYKTAMEHVLMGKMHEAIDIILTYYDKAYTNSLERKRERLKFAIDWDGFSAVSELASWLATEVGQRESEFVG